jgi:hypothetical protein
VSEHDPLLFRVTGFLAEVGSFPEHGQGVKIENDQRNPLTHFYSCGGDVALLRRLAGNLYGRVTVEVRALVNAATWTVTPVILRMVDPDGASRAALPAEGEGGEG